MRKPNRVLPVIATILVVAALVLGVSRLNAPTADHPKATPAAQSFDAASLDLDVRDTAPADVTACLTPDFAPDVAHVIVDYGVLQRRLGGTSPVLVLSNAAGDVRLCDQFGPDSPAQSPMPSASKAQPVAFASLGRSRWTCAGTSKVLDRFQKSTWLAVSPDVATVAQRFFVDGTPGPWFRTRARHGFAHLQAWIEGPKPAATTYAEQFRVLDASGHVVRQSALRTRPTLLPGCSAGGSAEIG